MTEPQPKIMTGEEYSYYSSRTRNLLSHLRWWIEMVEELNIKVGLESEIDLARQLKDELYEHWQPTDDNMSNAHGQDYVY